MNRTATFKIVDFGSLKALASVTINSMEIRGFKIIEHTIGDIWVGMPSKEVTRDGKKEYFDIIRFVGEDADAKKKEFHNWLIKKYKKAASEKPRKSRKKAVAGPKPATKEV